MSSIFNILTKPAPDESMTKILRDSVVEWIATTLFVFSGTLSAVSTSFTISQSEGIDHKPDVAQILPIAVVFGISILALAHSIGHLSGGHMNPGVTLLMYLKRQVSLTKLICYWVSQFVGAVLGASLMWGCTSDIHENDEIDRPPFLLGSTTLSPDLSHFNGFLIEFMGSVFFYFVIAQTALDKRGIATTAFPALPIGLVLIVVHILLIPFTGCGVNPARTFGPSMVVCMASSADDNCSGAVGDWYWIYFIGPFCASFVVAEITNLLELTVDGDDEEVDDDAAAGKKLPPSSPRSVEEVEETAHA